MTTMTMRYDGEYIDVETGQEAPFSYSRYANIVSLLRRMKDGDALVINAREEVDAWTNSGGEG